LTPCEKQTEGLRLPLGRLFDKETALHGSDAAHVDQTNGAAGQGLAAGRAGLAALSRCVLVLRHRWSFL